jgi:hypothetical protein
LIGRGEAFWILAVISAVADGVDERELGLLDGALERGFTAPDSRRLFC